MNEWMILSHSFVLHFFTAAAELFTITVYGYCHCTSHPLIHYLAEIIICRAAGMEMLIELNHRMWRHVPSIITNRLSSSCVNGYSSFNWPPCCIAAGSSPGIYINRKSGSLNSSKLVSDNSRWILAEFMAQATDKWYTQYYPHGVLFVNVCIMLWKVYFHSSCIRPSSVV